MAKFLFISVVLLFSTNCSKELPEKLINDNEIIDNEIIEVDRLSFASEKDFEIALENFASAETKSSANSNCRLNASLLSKSSMIDVKNDPILSYDFRNATLTKADDDANIYELGGYDELIPDENLAAFLNARAEIEVGRYIYKISPRGTYYFDPSKEDEFNRNYSVFEESEGILVDSLTVQLSEGIFRFATFEKVDTTDIMVNYFEEDEGEEGTFCATVTKATNSSLKNLNWSKYPRYQRKDNIFTKIFGHSYNWFFTNRRKFTGNFFSYDYLFWKSIGCEARMYKRSFIFWGNESAEELYAGWSNVITKLDLKDNAISYANTFKKKGLSVTTVTGKNIYTGSDQTVAYVFGLYLTQKEIDQAVGYGLQYLLTTLKTKLHNDYSSVDVMFLTGPDKIYTIYRKDGIALEDTHQCKHIFYQSAYFGMYLNILNLPSSWQEWAMVILKSIQSMPTKPELYKGEIHAAVKYNGEIGAMTIYN